MEEKKLYIKEYINERRKIIMTFIFVNFIYFIVYYLYQVPNYAYLYGVILSLFVGIVLITFDYIKYRQKIHVLSQLSKSIDISDIKLCNAEGIIEKEYQKLVEQLQTDLKHAIHEKEQHDLSLQEYLTMWTHQIKTPVAALRLLISNLEYSQEKLYLEQELFRVEEYIQMVLQYMRIDSISSDLLLKEYDLYSMAKQAVKKYSILFIHKHLSLNFDEFSCKVITDEKWIVFVIEQVLSNALKYTKEGTILIYQQKERGKVLVIEDTGIGIRSEDIPRVFERGYTGYNGRLDKKSTGLGMYLCKTILDKLGHKIEIESSLSIGTKVILDFNEYKLDCRD